MSLDKIKNLIKSILYGEKYNSESYVKYLRSLGMEIGDRTHIFVPTKTTIDITRPWLISIGSDVQITSGVTILTHGFDWSVLKGVYGEVLGSSGEVKIGNNVFIGMNSTILKGVTIGDNVIIGANSLVNKDIPNNTVAAGNPCKVIMSLETYYEKRKAQQLDEAKELVQKYRMRYGKEPDEKALHEFFWLFSDGNDNLPDSWEHMMNVCGNYEYSKSVLKNNRKQFENMEDFLSKV